MKEAKNIVVLGGGESGVGAAILAKQKGYKVFVSDFGAISKHYKEELKQYEIPYEEEKHSVDKILNTADLVIKSPGIPDKVSLIQRLKEKKVPIIDELEFAFGFTQAKIIAVTGSNGKTTTTRLIYHILKTGAYDVGLAGNIGFSLAKQVALDDKAYYAVEVSSFQLDNMHQFKADVAVLLNITPDHLDRYDYKIEDYTASKFRIVQNKDDEQVFIYNSDDANIQYGLKHFYNGNEAQVLQFSMNDSQFKQETLKYGDFEIQIKDLALKGKHNLFNISCAIGATKHLGISNEALTKALTSFENDPHRLESVISMNEVEFINDSKATNVDAVYYALDAMTKPIVWIVGGVDKGNDYTMLFPLVKEKVRAIVCLGKDNSKIFEAFKEVHEIIVECRSVSEAIKLSTLYAEAGDVVLLSPACSSFDLFENYKARGDQFKEVLMQQYKIMTEGIQVSLNLNFKINPVDNRSDEK